MTTELLKIDPLTDPRWGDVAERQASGLFGSPPWVQAIAETYGFPVRAHILADDRGPRAGIVSADVDDFRGRRLVSLPFSDYLDPAIESREDWEAVVAPLLDTGAPVQVRVLNRTEPLNDSRFTNVGELAWHRTDLTGDWEDTPPAFDANVRQNLRAATKRGVTVRFGSSLDDVRAFHAFHRRTRKRKYHMLAQPIAFFENIWKAFESHDAIFVGFATHEGEDIAASLYIQWNDVLYYKFGASIAERLSVRPNEMLAAASTRFARDRGCTSYDWGVSDLDQPGLVRYKRRYATEEKIVTVLRHLPPGAVYANGESGQVLGALTELLTREDVPDEVTQRAGELCYRLFA